MGSNPRHPTYFEGITSPESAKSSKMPQMEQIEAPESGNTFPSEACLAEHAGEARRHKAKDVPFDADFLNNLNSSH